MSVGCPLCKPYALDFQVINGKSYCTECGRLVQDDLELYILGNPHLRSAPRRSENSFERGVRHDERGIAYLDQNGQPLRMKEPFNPRHYGKSPLDIS